MVAPRVIACLDIRDGRVVKGIRFGSLRDAGDPVAASVRYEEDGADEIVLLDVSATPQGRDHAIDTVRAVRSDLSIPLTVGGGVRSVADAVALLEAGADRVAVNSAAVANPDLIARLAERFGTQCVVVSIDAKAVSELGDSRWEVVTHSGTRGTRQPVVDWAYRCETLGAGEVLLTSWDRDGTQAGYDLALIGAVANSVTIPVVASGGAGLASDLVDGLKAGADAVLVASILHDGLTTVGAVKSTLSLAGIGVRP